MKRRLGRTALERADIVVSKAGDVLNDFEEPAKPGNEIQSNQLLVRTTRDNCQAYYKGQQISLPSTFAQRQFLRTISDQEFILSDPDTAEAVLSFPLPIVALRVHGRFVASYSIKGVQVANLTKQWSLKAAEYQAQFESRGEQMPEVFDYQ